MFGGLKIGSVCMGCSVILVWGVDGVYSVGSCCRFVGCWSCTCIRSVCYAILFHGRCHDCRFWTHCVVLYVLGGGRSEGLLLWSFHQCFGGRWPGTGLDLIFVLA